MKGLKLKTLLLLTSFFLFDLVRPLGYSLVVEFAFLGIIFISLNEDLLPALLISAIFGLLCDSFNPNVRPASLIEFPFVCLLNHYLLSYFRLVNKKIHILIVKIFLVLLALVTHLIISSISSGLILPLFWIQFLVQSLLIYFSIEYLLKKNNEKAKPRTTI